ncbi:xanthine dehydrogenase molybdenum-binding subunit XdhA, partial [Christensenellaceae bacterium OttesenSCG-928-L17]|nr:xanthine dehydrogenase molybdenum-binding subunit XdhA [Christensenellaceae bacterium OttesenSCG-928-L17]
GICMSIGKSVPRVDGYDKVTGRAKYTDDLVDKSALVGKVLHATIANGWVKAMDTSEAERVPGVVKIVTCFDVPDIPFPTAGHPWSVDESHQDVQDRLLLNRRVRLYGDDIAAVVAEDEVAASRALRLIKVEYEQLPHVLDPVEAMKEGAPQLHDAYPNNILKHTKFEDGDFEAAIQEEGLIRIEGNYETPIVQHCHIEAPVSYCSMEGGRYVVVSSTQIPHIVRRVVGQALGIPWGKVRIIKPYIGGGFGNKQDVLYEPLNAYLCQQVGGRLVKLEISREETFFATRVRHAMKFHIVSYVRPNGRLVASECEVVSNQGAYASHGHSVVSKSMTSFRQLYLCEKACRVQGYTVYTNTAAAGAMRGYGTPQAIFAIESHAEDIARALNMDALQYRRLNMMPVGYVEPFSKNVNYFDSFNQCIEKGKAYIGWDEKQKLYANQTGPVRRGVGMALLWYNTAVWPISLEVSSCRMVLNQDGSVQIQLGETEIGQGADTAFAQMAADTLGIPFEKVHTISTQDTDITPFGLGAYASRQTYVGGMAIKKTATLLKEKILNYAHEMTRMQVQDMDIVDGNIVWKTNDNEVLVTLEYLAQTAFYSMEHAEHLTAEATAQCKSNAYSFGCSFAEVEVDIPMGKVKVLNIVNVHDCGKLINPQLAEMQVHGGMSMGIGFGVSERLMYDEKTGRALNDNLLDYKLSTTMDHPHLEAQFVENYEPTSAYGTKALGEPPTVPGAPAIRNAVLNATGVAVNHLPLNPHTLFPAFKEAGLI